MELEALGARHPCHACPDRGSTSGGRRARRARADIAGLERRIRSRTETLARQFDRVLAVLEELGYVERFGADRTRADACAGSTRRATSWWSSRSRTGLFEGLSPSEVAALVSTVVYESRERVPLPAGAAHARASRTRTSCWAHDLQRIRRVEDEHQVELCRELDAGFATPVFALGRGQAARGRPGDPGWPPGDFVRNCKQLLDLLRQIEDVADPAVASVARAAAGAVDRNVVAYSGVAVPEPSV